MCRAVVRGVQRSAQEAQRGVRGGGAGRARYQATSHASCTARRGGGLRVVRLRLVLDGSVAALSALQSIVARPAGTAPGYVSLVLRIT